MDEKAVKSPVAQVEVTSKATQKPAKAEASKTDIKALFDKVAQAAKKKEGILSYKDIQSITDTVKTITAAEVNELMIMASDASIEIIDRGPSLRKGAIAEPAACRSSRCRSSCAWRCWRPPCCPGRPGSGRSRRRRRHRPGPRSGCHG